MLHRRGSVSGRWGPKGSRQPGLSRRDCREIVRCHLRSCSVLEAHNTDVAGACYGRSLDWGRVVAVTRSPAPGKRHRDRNGAVFAAAAVAGCTSAALRQMRARLDRCSFPRIDRRRSRSCGRRDVKLPSPMLRGGYGGRAPT